MLFTSKDDRKPDGDSHPALTAALSWFSFLCETPFQPLSPPGVEPLPATLCRALTARCTLTIAFFVSVGNPARAGGLRQNRRGDG